MVISHFITSISSEITGDPCKSGWLSSVRFIDESHDFVLLIVSFSLPMI